jgi:ABC-type transport system involved in multi-copper enzyme maturation permease subunit
VGRYDPSRELAEALEDFFLRFVLPLIALTLVAQGWAQEVSERTLVYHLVRPISRRTVFLARYASGLVPAWIAAAAFLAGLFATARASVPATTVAQVGFVAVLGVAAVGAVYYLLAALLRHGIVAALIYTFVVETLVSSLRGSVQSLSISFHLRSLLHRWTDVAFGVDHGERPRGLEDMDLGRIVQEALREEYDTPVQAIVILVLVAAGSLGFGLWRVARRDFPLKD